MRILIDANVPLNVWLKKRPMVMDSAAVLRAVGNGEVQGCMTASLAMFVMVALRRAKGAAYAKDKGNALLDIITLIPMPMTVLRAGLTDGWHDIEDGFQYQAARLHGQVDFIVTNNKRHYDQAKGPMAITPKEFVAKHLK